MLDLLSPSECIVQRYEYRSPTGFEENIGCRRRIKPSMAALSFGYALEEEADVDLRNIARVVVLLIDGEGFSAGGAGFSDRCPAPLPAARPSLAVSARRPARGAVGGGQATAGRERASARGRRQSGGGERKGCADTAVRA